MAFIIPFTNSNKIIQDVLGGLAATSYSVGRDERGLWLCFFDSSKYNQKASPPTLVCGTDLVSPQWDEKAVKMVINEQEALYKEITARGTYFDYTMRCEGEKLQQQTELLNATREENNILKQQNSKMREELDNLSVALREEKAQSKKKDAAVASMLQKFSRVDVTVTSIKGEVKVANSKILRMNNTIQSLHTNIRRLQEQRERIAAFKRSPRCLQTVFSAWKRFVMKKRERKNKTISKLSRRNSDLESMLFLFGVSNADDAHIKLEQFESSRKALEAISESMYGDILSHDALVTAVRSSVNSIRRFLSKSTGTIEQCIQWAVDRSIMFEVYEFPKCSPQAWAKSNASTETDIQVSKALLFEASRHDTDGLAFGEYMVRKYDLTFAEVKEQILSTVKHMRKHKAKFAASKSWPDVVKYACETVKENNKEKKVIFKVLLGSTQYTDVIDKLAEANQMKHIRIMMMHTMECAFKKIRKWWSAPERMEVNNVFGHLCPDTVIEILQQTTESIQQGVKPEYKMLRSTITALTGMTKRDAEIILEDFITAMEDPRRFAERLCVNFTSYDAIGYDGFLKSIATRKQSLNQTENRVDVAQTVFSFFNFLPKKAEFIDSIPNIVESKLNGNPGGNTAYEILLTCLHEKSDDVPQTMSKYIHKLIV